MSEKLDLKLEIYLPAKYESEGNFQQDLIHKLKNTFGGVTILPNNHGIWLNNKETVYDDITIIRIFTTKVQFNNPLLALRLAFYTAIEQIREHYRQSCIAFTINDVMEFY